MNIRLMTGAALALATVPALAQQPAAQPTAMVVTPATAQTAMVVTPDNSSSLHAGLPIQLETRDELTTEHKALKVGHQVEMEVIQPVMLNEHVVIPAGSRAIGEVTAVRNKGMWGKSGGIDVKVLYAEANGRQIRLNGTFDEHGQTGTAGVVGAIAVLPIAGFFVTGTSARIAPHTHVTAFLAEDIAVQFAGAQPGPAGSASTLAK